ncbi:hypothetical protein [uncultured Lutibacter sp.]|uniref:hypothetical protein n=1 Tax=uncultured Lutibacter sp. TaxID=437739 RepID=UPI002607A0C1|nr:hypothetical protein [uncultured Lutibacter sp.]
MTEFIYPDINGYKVTIKAPTKNKADKIAGGIQNIVNLQTNLTEHQKHTILELFYRTELRFCEKVINNTDIAIANELGITKGLVTNLIQNHLDFKFKRINSGRLV